LTLPLESNSAIQEAVVSLDSAIFNSMNF